MFSASAEVALANFNAMYERLKFNGAFFGINPDPRAEYSTSALSHAWIAFLLSLVLCSFYTLCVADSEIVWRSCAIAPMLAQGLCKLHVHTTYIQPISELLAHLRRIYRLNCVGTRNARNAAVLLRWSARIRPVVMHSWIVVMLTGVVFLAAPAFTYWLTGQLEPIFEVWLPGVDHQNSTVGYAILYAVHCVLIGIGAGGTCGSDLLLVMLTMHLWPMADIFWNTWREIDGAVAMRSAGCNDRKLQRCRRALIRTMLQQHRDIAAYLSDITRVYWSMIFCEVFTCCGMLCINLYCSLVLHWLPAPVFGGLLFAKLLLYCILGTLVELATDRVYAVLVQNDWYRWPVAERRLLVVLVACAQRPQLLMAGQMPLNMVTCVETLKTVYSVGMLLLS